ncbi:MAG: hypothetical protein EBZ87_04620 [Microbacteriaceae bacterium]|nr:hypothetical protein [Microbacteriaceae bacterium]
MAHRRSISLLVLTIAALSLSSCASPAATPSTSPEPTVTPTATPTDTFDSEILLANNEIEEEFLRAALDSCELAKTQSLVLWSYEESDGQLTNSTYFRPVESSEQLLFPENQISEGSAGEDIPDLYNNYLPPLFDSCLLEQQAALADDLNAELFEHTVEQIGPYEYAWSQHQGGANLEKMYYTVTDGIISRYSKDNEWPIGTEVMFMEFSGDLENKFIAAYGN